MRLLAALDRPPVAEVVKPTAYCVRAPAPADGLALTTVRFATGLARAGEAKARSATKRRHGEAHRVTLSARRVPSPRLSGGLVGHAPDTCTRPEPPVALPPARTVQVPGRGECFVRDSGGDGPPVLLLHGWTVTADVSRYAVYGPLADAGSA